MKKVLRLIFVFFALFLSLSFFLLSLFKTKTIDSFDKDQKIIASYKQWGLSVDKYQNQLGVVLIKTKNSSPFLLPFHAKTFDAQRKYILASVLEAYVNEVNANKQSVDLKLTYLRDRLKISTDLTNNQKDSHFQSLDGIAGAVFEKEPTLAEIKKAINDLSAIDTLINKEIDAHQKDNIFAEVQTYKGTCEELKQFFETKDKQDYATTANRCIEEADKLLLPQYQNNSASFIESIARERVFTLVQLAQNQKVKVFEEEQYALQKEKKDAEYLSIVPSAIETKGKVVVVNLKLQRLYAYENGVSLFPHSVLITSGKQGFETITGRFAIYLKERYHKMQSPFPGIYYDDVVDYWMPFFSGYGLHDASWRQVYGTFDYLTVGSHGCVNMTLNDAAVLYNWVEVGTTVIVL